MGRRNLFDEITAGRDSTLAVVDWDADANLDLILGTLEGTTGYFRHTIIGCLHESTWDENPFVNIDIGFASAPAVVDWDSDDGLDLFAWNACGIVRFFDHIADGRLAEHTSYQDLLQDHGCILCSDNMW